MYFIHSDTTLDSYHLLLFLRTSNPFIQLNDVDGSYDAIVIYLKTPISSFSCSYVVFADCIIEFYLPKKLKLNSIIMKIPNGKIPFIKDHFALYLLCVSGSNFLLKVNYANMEENGIQIDSK